LVTRDNFLANRPDSAENIRDSDAELFHRRKGIWTVKRPITLVTDSLSRRRGGAEVYMASLAGFLVQNGHPVHALMRRDNADFAMDGVEVETVPARGTGLRGDLNFARYVEQRLQERRSLVLSTIALPGVTHYQPHMGLQWLGWAASRDSRDSALARVAHALTTPFNLRRRWLLRMQEQLFCRHSPTKVMVFSELVRNQITQHYPISPENIVTIPLGVDLQCFQPAARPERAADAPLHVLFVAHNFRLKGLHCLLSALSRARHSGLKAELVVAGNGDRKRYDDMIARLGLSGLVSFVGAMDQAGTAELYRAADVLAHPTFTDHCSLVVLEALACGLPVITTRQNGAAELMSEGKQGIVINHAREIDALAGALLRLQDRRELAIMREAAIALRLRLDFNEHARQVLAWLENS
jgi:UDP-glucose:(heptosyl)LPS alpha-1,3-glucosyltransferase